MRRLTVLLPLLLAGLPRQQARAVRLIDLEGAAPAEAARALGVAPTTLYGYHSTALRRLRARGAGPRREDRRRCS